MDKRLPDNDNDHVSDKHDNMHLVAVGSIAKVHETSIVKVHESWDWSGDTNLDSDSCSSSFGMLGGITSIGCDIAVGVE